MISEIWFMNQFVGKLQLMPAGVLEVGISRHHVALHLPSTNEMMHHEATLTHYWSLSTAASATPAS